MDCFVLCVFAPLWSVLSASDARLALVLSASGTRLEPTETEWRAQLAERKQLLPGDNMEELLRTGKVRKDKRRRY